MSIVIMLPPLPSRNGHVPGEPLPRAPLASLLFMAPQWDPVWGSGPFDSSFFHFSRILTRRVRDRPLSSPKTAEEIPHTQSVLVGKSRRCLAEPMREPGWIDMSSWRRGLGLSLLSHRTCVSLRRCRLRVHVSQRVP